MSLSDKVKDYFFGTQISEEYEHKISQLHKEFSNSEELKSAEKRFALLKWIDIGMCKYAPNFVSFSTLAYGVYSQNAQLVVWGLVLGEGSRNVFGYFHKNLRRDAGVDSVE